MLLKFTKMHGLGNDFMVVDGVTQKVFFSTDLIKKLSDRHFGIGFDQLLLVEPPFDPEVDFHYRIFNADGSEVQMCGNGARCFVRFVIDQQLTNKRDITVSTVSGVLRLKLNDDDTVTVNMGTPRFDPKALPFTAPEQNLSYKIKVSDGTEFEHGAVSMGNPHSVIYVDDVDNFPLERLGRYFENHPSFPKRVNTEFIQIIDRKNVKMRVWERGSGITQACGTGACATAVAAVVTGRAPRTSQIVMDGGTLTIEWRESDNHVYMTGPATFVFDGEIELED